LMGITEEALPYIWVEGAIETPIEALISVVASVIIGIPLITIIFERNLMNLSPLNGLGAEVYSPS